MGIGIKFRSLPTSDSAIITPLLGIGHSIYLFKSEGLNMNIMDHICLTAYKAITFAITEVL